MVLFLLLLVFLCGYFSYLIDLINMKTIIHYRAGYSSESEVELDGPMNEVILPQQIKSRGNIKSAKSAVRYSILKILRFHNYEITTVLEFAKFKS